MDSKNSVKQLLLRIVVYVILGMIFYLLVSRTVPALVRTADTAFHVIDATMDALTHVIEAPDLILPATRADVMRLEDRMRRLEFALRLRPIQPVIARPRPELELQALAAKNAVLETQIRRLNAAVRQLQEVLLAVLRRPLSRTVHHIPLVEN